MSAFDLNNSVFVQKIARRVHLLENIRFNPITAEQFKAGDLLYQSAKTGKRRLSGSTYRLIVLDGELAFARESNHWGKFSTNSHLGSGKHNWELVGTKTGNDGARYCGAVLLRDVWADVAALSAILDYRAA